MEFDEDLEGDQPEDRHTLPWARGAHDFYRNSSWSSPFQVPESHRSGGVRGPRIAAEKAPIIEPPVAPPNDLPSKGLSEAERAALIEGVEDFISSQLDDLFKERAEKPPEWVNDVADRIREIDRDYPEARTIMMVTGLTLRLPRELLLLEILDEEQAADYRRFMELMTELGDIGPEAVGRSIDKFGQKRGLSEEDISDLKLVASTGIFAATAALGLKKSGKTSSNKILTPIKNPQDLVGGRRSHILNRHASGAAKSGKTEFPSNWDNDRIIHQISDVAFDPKSARGMGKWGSPYAIGTRDGIDIRVDFYPNKLPNGLSHPKAGEISTAYPTNVTVNP